MKGIIFTYFTLQFHVYYYYCERENTKDD